MTTEERLEALEKELARAKRRNRWALTGTALVFVLGVVLCGKAAGPSQASAQPAAGTVNEVRASKFTLVDQNGTPRVILAMTQLGPALAFLDAQGKLRVDLTVTEAGPVLALRDAQEKARIDMFVTEVGGPALFLNDAQGKPIWTAP